jgi:hypothetical protein
MSKRSYTTSQGNVEMGSKIYVDNKMVLENDISMDDLIRMSEQKNKFQLSQYLKRKVRREKVKRGLLRGGR